MRRQPFILLSFSSSKKPRKVQETQSYQRFQHIVHTAFNTSGTNGPRLLSRVKMGTHSPLPTGSHTAAYTPKQGLFRMGALLLPSERFTHFGNPAWPGVRTANFAAFGSWSEALLKDTESLRNSDALLCASLFRGVAAPLGCVIFFASVEIATCTPCAQGLSVCARRGVVSLPSARFTCC